MNICYTINSKEGDFIININHIINRKFNTDKGVLYLVELLQKEFPTLKMNLDVLPKLNVVEMTEEYYEKTGFVAEFVYDRSEIKLLTELEGTDQLTEEEILKSFFHELVHALTSWADDEIIYEGINFRDREENKNSFFVGLNEGITQYIVNKVLGEQKDAYPYETLFATQLVAIIGEDNLIECYSNNSYIRLQEILNNTIPYFNQEDFRMFIQAIYLIQGYLKEKFNCFQFGECLKIVQDITIKWYNSSKESDKGKLNFEDLILTREKAIEIQRILLKSWENFGLEELDELEEIKGEKNGKKQ